MAATFRDAITITRELDLQYLWIDCFCILQDSVEDWRVESARMTSVYENSHVTIAAMDAADSSAGIFQQRRRVIWPLYTNQQNYLTQLEFGITPIEKRYSGEPPPLSSRAWVLQEYFSSPAILQYSDTQISWVCNSYRFFEDDPIASIQSVRQPSVFSKRYVKGHLDDKIFFASPLTGWVRVVSEYTRRELTIKSDRLLAISALVEDFAKTYKLTPLAGL
jgi:hypothetical protein